MLLSELDQDILLRLIESKEPLSSTYLSVVCHVAINTIRKEIDVINDYLLNKGCHIQIKQAVGYEFIIDDDNLAIPFIEQFSVELDRYRYLNISENQDYFFITRHLLISDRPVSVDSIADRLYISKSTISRLIKKIKSYLEIFDLDIKVKRNSGLYICGAELAKRLCLINMHKIYIHTPNRELSIDPLFNATFMIDMEVDVNIRRSIYKMLSRFDDISISAIDIPKIFNYIILTKTRSKHRDELTLNESQIAVLSDFPNDPIDYLIDILPEIFRSEFKEIDRLILKAIIYSYNQKSFGDIHKTKAYLISKDCIEHVTSFYCGISQAVDEMLIEDFARFIQQIYYRHLFDIKTDEEAFLLTNNRGIFTTDIAAFIADHLKTKYGIELSLNDCAKTYAIIYRAIHQNFRGPYHKLSILCISRYGYYYANVIKARIDRQYHKFIKNSEIAESSILFDQADLSRYDLIVTDMGFNVPILNDLKDIPVIYISFKRTNEDFKYLDKYLRSLVISDICEIFTKEDLIVSDTKDIKSIIKIIYEKLDIDCTFERFNSDLKEKSSYTSFKRSNSIALLSSLKIKTNKPVFIIIALEKPLIIDNDLFSAVFYYNYGPTSLVDIKKVNNIISQLIHRNPYFINLLHKFNYQEIIDSIGIEDLN